MWGIEQKKGKKRELIDMDNSVLIVERIGGWVEVEEDIERIHSKWKHKIRMKSISISIYLSIYSREVELCYIINDLKFTKLFYIHYLI